MSFESNSLIHVSPALTKEFLNAALTKWFQEPVTFTHWQYVSGTGKGDSFIGETIFIKIYGNTKHCIRHTQVVLKSIPKNVCRRLTFRNHEFFANEINFYTKILPVLLEFQSKKSPVEPFSGYAKLFLSYTDGENDVLSLEDLSVYGYKNAIRQKGLDLCHCKASLKSLAQFHAISFAMKDQEPDMFKKLATSLNETYYSVRYWDWYKKYWNRLCCIAIDAVEKEYPNTIYVDKVKEFAVPERYQYMIEAVNDRTNGVITHGDSWTTNFLYKYNNNVENAKIIDFQSSRYSSPVLDISFFIYACTTQELRLEHYDDLLKYYYRILSTNINEMGSDPKSYYSWETFMNDVKKYSYFGLAFSFESTPFIVLDADDAVEMDIEVNM